MPIQIIQDDERLTYELAGSKIYYRRISTMRRSAIVRKHTKRGKTNWQDVTADIIEYVITGWDTVQSKGVDVPFSIDLAKRLPEDCLSDIVALAGGAGDEDADEDAEKN